MNVINSRASSKSSTTRIVVSGMAHCDVRPPISIMMLRVPPPRSAWTGTTGTLRPRRASVVPCRMRSTPLLELCGLPNPWLGSVRGYGAIRIPTALRRKPGLFPDKWLSSRNELRSGRSKWDRKPDKPAASRSTLFPRQSKVRCSPSKFAWR